MRRLPCSILIAFLLTALTLHGAQYLGSVRAADQPVPGATITARQGETKVTGYTDENGRYALELTDGEWDIQVEMFEFTAARQHITMGVLPVVKDWALEMPKLSERDAKPEPAKSEPQKPEAPKAAPQTAANTPRPRPQGLGPGRGGPGRGGPGGAGPQPQRGFQSAAVQAADGSTLEAAPPEPVAAGDDEAFLVNGSTSGGLGAASDDEARRQRPTPGRGPGGGQPSLLASAMGDPGSVVLPPGMSTNDSLGLGGFGAGAITSGFGVGPAGGGGDFGGAGVPAGPGGGGGRGGGGGGGGGGRGGGGSGGGRGARGPNNRNAKRGPFDGQFASFGNKRKKAADYTGNVSYTARNSALNAAPFSLNGQPAQKPYSAANNFTATVGGPVIIPKLVNWKTINFNVSYSGGLNRNGSNLLGSVPTLAERAGDFSAAKKTGAAQIFDPLNGAPFPNSQIPASRINPASAGLLQYFPQPIYGGLVQNYRLISTVPSDSQSIGVRVSAPVTKKDRINFNVQYQDRSSKSRGLFGFTDNSSGYGLSASAGWSHSFAPRFTNSANLTFSRNIGQNTPFFAFTSNIAGALGISGTAQDPVNYGPPSLSFTNFSGLNDGSASLSRNQTTNFTDSLTYIVKKKHNLTFGYLYRRLQQNSLNYANARGSMSFSGLLTSQLNGSGQPVTGTGFDFADFLLGFPQSSSVRFGGSNNYFRSWATSWYAQDDMRLRAGLTINIGLRYEYFAPYTERFNHLANLDLKPGFTAVSVVLPGQTGPWSGELPTSLVRSSPNSYSPRFGIAWRPFPKKSLIIRSGYSIFYSGSPYATIANSMAAQPPFARTASISTSLSAPLTIENGFATTPSQTITNTYAVDPNYKLSYAQSWNFTVQDSLPKGLVVEVEYIGTKGTNLAINEQPNRAVAGSTVATQSLQIANATGFSYLTTGANSNYNAGQIRLTRRFSRGISSNLLYTYAKSIDDASTFQGTGGTLVQFLDNLRLERGLSSFDKRHNLQTTFQFSSPVGTRGILRNAGWKATLLRGWTLNGTLSATPGTPLTAYVSGNLANTGGLAAFGTSRAQATGLPVDGTNGAYFNLAAFTLPPTGQFGNAGRNTIPGLFQFAVNSSLNRAFRFGESRRQLQLRINASNVLNHVTITNVGTTVNSASYGLPTGASGTRNINLLLRYNF